MYEYAPPVSTACTCHYPCDLYPTQQPYALGLPNPGTSQCLDMEGTFLHPNILFLLSIIKHIKAQHVVFFPSFVSEDASDLTHIIIPIHSTKGKKKLVFF